MALKIAILNKKHTSFYLKSGAHSKKTENTVQNFKKTNVKKFISDKFVNFLQMVFGVISVLP